MWLTNVLVVRVVKAVTRRGDPYLRVWLEPGGRTSCFYEDVFPNLQAACDSDPKKPIDVQVEESDNVDARGRPYTNVLATAATGTGRAGA